MACASRCPSRSSCSSPEPARRIASRPCRGTSSIRSWRGRLPGRSSPERSPRPGVPTAESFEYQRDGKRYRYDVCDAASAWRLATPRPMRVAAAAAVEEGRPAAPERGRQFASADSPDNTLRAVYNERDRNLHVVDMATGCRHADHHRRQQGEAHQVRHRPCWVYGEELGQTNRDVVVARQPEARVLSLRRIAGRPTTTCSSTQTKLQSEVDTEAYPESRHAESDRRSAHLRRRDEEDHDARRPRRKAVRQRRRRPLRVSRAVVAATGASCCSTAPTGGRTCSSSAAANPETGDSAS